MQDEEKKQIVRNALAKVVAKLRIYNKKSQFMFASENDLSTSTLSMLERGIKDPQLTTVFKLAEAFDMSVAEFVKLIDDELPKGFSFIDK